MSLARRLLRLLGRAMIAWGLQKGLDETASLVLFRIGSIDSIEGLPPRRIPIHTDRSIRELIGAPIVTTFSHMSPTATAFHTRKNAPDAMKAISQYDRSFFSSDEKPRPGPSGLKNLNSNLNSNGSGSFEEKETVQSAIVPALVIQGVGAPATNNATYPNQVTNTTTTTIPQRYTPSPPNNRNFKNDTFTPTPSTSTPGPGQDQDQGPGQDQDYQRGKRVTLAYDGLAAPVLDIRFSSQAFAFADANVLIKRLGSKHSPSGSTDGSGHVHSHGHGHLAPIAEQRTGISRSKTFVGNVAATTTSSSGGGTGTGSGSSPFADPPLPRGRSRSLSQKSTVPPELNNPFADSYEVLLSPDGVLGSSQESSSYFSSMGRNGEPGKLTRKRTLSGSSEDEGEEGSLRAIHKLSKKFPSLPPGVASVRPEELFANANASAPRPRPRSKSMNNMGRRKPPPQLLTDLEEEAKSVTLVTQQQQQQPTPVRARMTKPRPRSKSQPPVPDQTVLKRNAGVYDDGEYEIAGGDSPRRFAGQLSPTTSLDQDIAMRTRRRIRNHLSTITPTSSSVRSSAAGGDDEQWATVPQPFTPSSVLALARQEPQKSNGSLRNRPGITTGTATATASPSSLFSSPNPLPRGRETSRGYGSGPRRRNTGETIDSPFTVYTRESEYSVQMEEDVEFSPPLLVDRPMGRIARRALGIEQFLGEEKEKWEASQDGHDPTTTTTTATTTTTMTAGAAMAVPHPYAAVVAPGTVSAGAAAAGSSRGLNVPEDVTDIADYRASNIVLSPPNTSRRRPRSDVDTLRNPIPFVFASSGRERMPRSKNNNVRSNTSIGIQEIGNVPITPSSTATTPTSTLKRSVTTVDDPDARRAFAAAWKTVNPNVASPTIAGLKNVASVSVKRTPPPVTHRKVLSGHSISADEGNFESVLPVVDESVELPPLLENTAPPLMMTNPMLVRRSLVGTVGTMRTADGEIGFGRMRGSVING
ncbi:hypothetical protein FRC20_004307 [Serendipita sp. 405]|nr:hypothetical protein FRC15_004333 [Serendipita sp. 397]KAG8842695.1 hypothetical protein FRC20_004307 [Serendipita sp. 405]